jgi:subfamily B ATP-binding cassette protein MsbA
MDTEARPPGNGRGTRALLPFLRLYPWGMPLIVVLGVLTSLTEGIGLSLFIPLLQGLEGSDRTSEDPWWVDTVSGVFDDVRPDDVVRVVALCVFAAICLRALLSYLNTVVAAWLDARIGHRLRSAIEAQLLEVEYSFIERSRLGDLLNTLATETWRVNDALGSLVSLIVLGSSIAVYVAVLLLLSVPLTLAVAVVMLVIAGIVRLVTRRVRRLGEESTRANARLAERMVEGLWLMPVIRAFGRERYEQDRFDVESKTVSDVMLRTALVSGLVGPIYEVLAGALLVGVVVVALDEQASVGSLLLFIFVLYRLHPKISAFDGERVHLRSLLAAVDDVSRLLDRSDKPYLAPGTTAQDGVRSEIELDDVSFRYGPREASALDHVSLRIPAGQVTALVGPSGAGKTTLIKLLLRLYDPTDGEIRIDGRPLPDLDIESWRGRIGFVGQDVQLFNATVADNIGYGRPGATRADIEEAARRADAHDFISRLPDGYDTLVGDDGVRLSGGQQQRLTFARAVIRNPDVLILDEATNALDSRSERFVQDALDLLSRDRTVIIIAHRFSTIERADRIVVLEAGRVREAGDRAALLASEGLYRELHDLERGRSAV